MSVVHQSKGTLTPASENLLSESMIVARLAEATLGARTTFPFVETSRNYDRIREVIARTLPGFENFNERVRHPGGFYLPNAARERDFQTATGKANFSDAVLSGEKPREGETDVDDDPQPRPVQHHRLRPPRPLPRHRERETRPLHAPRRHAERGLKPLAEIDVRNEIDGRLRVAERFLAIPYELPKGAVAGYFPELNVLVPIGRDRGDLEHTPARNRFR